MVGSSLSGTSCRRLIANECLASRSVVIILDYATSLKRDYPYLPRMAYPLFGYIERNWPSVEYGDSETFPGSPFDQR